MSWILCFIFFLSGMAALVFEALWFRLAGLTFGNSVWASSLVLSSFMGGLALGNYIAARWGWRLRHHVAVYALLELIIGCSGLALVLLFPYFNDFFAPMFRPLLDHTLILNVTRFCVAFVLMCLPATAMGATLPILVKAFLKTDVIYGKALGRLYGWNTFGAVFGALAGDLVLYRLFGLNGSGMIAFLVNCLAAVLAFSVRKRFPLHHAAPADGWELHLQWMKPATLRVIGGAFLAGGVLLSLEVIWFRFMLLFVHGIGLAFATMLAVVLLGIGLGGMAAAAWIKRHPAAPTFLPHLCLVSGTLVVLLYAFFDLGDPNALVRQTAEFDWTLLRTLRLMFPVSLISGVLFTFMGVRLKQTVHEETRTTGLLTIANTFGAMLGAGLAGFVLLPVLGMERSFFVCAAVYAVIAIVMIERETWQTMTRKWSFWSLAGLLGLVLLIFPHSLMANHYLDIVLKRFSRPDEPLRILQVEEGLSETIILTGRFYAGVPLRYRLITNGHSMSGVSVASDRYMKDYVYLPVAFHPNPKRALLISYGVGNTAKALVDTESFERIDIVDISREILGMSEIIFADEGENPLNDPRVHVHIEDGRHFLQTTDLRFDLITAEPPPPKNAGIVNLYTRDFFALARRCLAEEGMITYWLPLMNLLQDDAYAIMRAFGEVFPDFTLWTGAGFEWMLVGSRGLATVKTEGLFAQQWRHEEVYDDLVAAGFETPGFIGATFLADAAQLEPILTDVKPLTDQFPLRLSQRFPQREDWVWGDRWMDPSACLQRFQASKWIARFWPETLRDDAIRAFQYQGIANRFLDTRKPHKNWTLDQLRPIITDTPYRFLVLWMKKVTYRMVKAAKIAAKRGVYDWEIEFVLFVDAWADRDFARGDTHLARLTADPEQRLDFYEDRVFGLCLAGDLTTARQVFDEWTGIAGDATFPKDFDAWYRQVFVTEVDAGGQEKREGSAESGDSM